MVPQLYDDNLYRFDAPQPSYWEATAGDTRVDATPLSGPHACDVAVIGGGYTGLSAALHLARDHELDVRVLEAGHFGWGASGRNGGFCCIGGVGVRRKDLLRMVGVEPAKEYYRAQVEAVELVRQIVDAEGLEVQNCGDAELEVAHSARAYERLQAECELLSTTFGEEAEIIPAGAFRERYYDSPEQHGALLSRPAFGLHPLRYCRGLASAASKWGAHLHDRSEVLEWTRSEDGAHRLVTADGSLRARRVLFATNGFMPESLHPAFFARSLPIVSAIVVTRPLTRDELAAQHWQMPQPAINSRLVMNYFRLLPDNRLLFGGRGHPQGDPRGERENYAAIEGAMRRMLPHWAQVEIDYRWHGLICYTRSFCPSLGRLDEDPSVFFGFGYHGNGVNTATWSGKQLAEWIARGSAPGIPSIMRGLGRRYRPASLRLKLLQLGIGISSWLDRRS